MRDFFCVCVFVFNARSERTLDLLSIETLPDQTMHLNCLVGENGCDVCDFVRGEEKFIDVWCSGNERVLHLHVDFDTYEWLPLVCGEYGSPVEEVIRLIGCRYVRRVVPWTEVPANVRDVLHALPDSETEEKVGG